VIEFYFIVIILFIFDSFVWVKNYSIGLHSFTGNKFINKTKGFYFLNFLPITQFYVVEKPQFTFTEDGLFIIKKSINFEKKCLIDSDYEFIHYQNIHNIEKSGGSLIINNNISIIAHSKSNLNNTYNMLDSIIQTSPDKRLSLVKTHYLKLGDLKAIETQLNHLIKALLFLDPLGIIFFIMFFIVFPLSLFGFISLPITMFNLFVVLGFIHLFIIAIVLFIYFRKVMDNFDLGYLIPILLYPLSSAHLASNIFRNVFRNYNFLSVMSVLLKENDFIEIAKNEFKINIISKESSTNDNYIELLSSKNEMIKNLLLEKNISLEQLTNAPRKIDESSMSYCPVCEIEYLMNSGFCSDCQVPLRQFS